MKATLVFILTLLSCNALSQEISIVTPKKHRFLFNVCGFRSIGMKSDLERYSKDPDRMPIFFQAYDANNVQAGVQYEHLLHKNFDWGIGLSFGSLERKYRYNYDFEYFSDKHDFTPFNTSYAYKNNTPYASLMLSLGYRQQPFANKAMSVFAKAGLAYVQFFNTKNYSFLQSLQYKVADTVHTVPYAYTEIIEYKSAMYYDLSMGVSFPIKNSIVKEYNIGFVFTHSFGRFKKEYDHIGMMYSLHYNAQDRTPVASETYHNRFRQIGLRIGIAF